MKRQQREWFQSYWRHVSGGENYVRTYGARGWAPDCREAEPFHELIAAFEAIKPLLNRVARPRMFWTPPMARGHAPFMANTAHEAIVFFLSPLENLFGHVGALESPEYRLMKEEAYSEGRAIQAGSRGTHRQKGKMTPRLKRKVDEVILCDHLYMRHFGDGRVKLTEPMSMRQMARELDGWNYSRVRRLLREHMPEFYSRYQAAFVDSESALFLKNELGKKRRNGKVFDDLFDAA